MKAKKDQPRAYSRVHCIYMTLCTYLNSTDVSVLGCVLVLI